MDLDQAAEVCRRDGDRGFVWIGMFEPDPEELEKVQARFGLHDLAVEDAQSFHLRPKVERFDDAGIFFAVLRTARYDDAREEVDFGEVSLFLSQRFIITVRHGAASDAVRVFAAEAERLGVREAIAARLAHDRGLPGFGHPLYPEGDPRAAALLGRIALPPHLAQLQAAVRTQAGLHPTIDFALIAGCEAHALPGDAPFGLFAVARCAGWIAHAIEQGQSDALIRPRARYVGPEPESLGSR